MVTSGRHGLEKGERQLEWPNSWIAVTSCSLYSANTIMYDNTKRSLYRCAADGQQHGTYLDIQFCEVQ